MTTTYMTLRERQKKKIQRSPIEIITGRRKKKYKHQYLVVYFLTMI